MPTGQNSEHVNVRLFINVPDPFNAKIYLLFEIFASKIAYLTFRSVLLLLTCKYSCDESVVERVSKQG